MHRFMFASRLALLAVTLAPGLGAGQGASPARRLADLETAIGPDQINEITVVGSTPLAGSDLHRDQVPDATLVLDASDIGRTGIPSLTAAILENVAAAGINDTEGNVFQPDILFHGFTSSPVAGTPEGLAIYVNGARFDDAFGDAVNWDLIPPVAIESVAIEAANPLFGLNALGGSMSVRLKSGFTTHSGSVTVYGGSYGREAAILEFGRQFGDFAVYAAGDATHDGGFRQTSSSDLYRLYVDLGWRLAGGEWHGSMTAAHDTLGNPGATPEQALNANIANIFTAPNVVANTDLGFNLNGSLALDAVTSLQTLGYFQTFQQVIPNGTTVEVAPCANGTDLLCNGDGTVVTTLNSQPVRDFLHGGPYSGLSVEQLGSHAYGASAQLTDNAPLAGFTEHLVGGVSFDGSYSVFAGVAQIGGFDPYSREFVGPSVIQDQPSEGVNPVRVKSDTRFYGVFVSDVLSPAPDLDLTLAGRYNDAQVDLEDLRGGPVNGQHAYARFNPYAGLTWRIGPRWQLYGSYAETNRAPTPLELSCASAAKPCSLLNFFVGDPQLQQVVAHTLELGLRSPTDARAGCAAAASGEGAAAGSREGAACATRWSWNLDVYRTRNTDDIIYEATTYNPNLAYYTNAGRTLRRGAEASVRFERGALELRLGYAYTEAQFRTPLLLGTQSPAADASGNEHVLPGARIPGIPLHRATVVVEVEMSERLRLGGSYVVQSGVYRFGDEANVTQPLGGYGVLDLDASFRPVEHLTLFASLDNVLDKRYSTYGAFGPVSDVPWPNVPGGVTDPRTASPGAPITVYGGVRVTF